ncbi:hypothetical protein ZWY2020_003316, partial [Hordeum vulgare]
KGGSSSLAKVHNGWLKLWSAKVPGKVRDYRKWIVQFAKHNGTPNFGRLPEEYINERCFDIFTRLYEVPINSCILFNRLPK